jgi:hypothetical protein
VKMHDRVVSAILAEPCSLNGAQTVQPVISMRQEARRGSMVVGLLIVALPLEVANE